MKYKSFISFVSRTLKRSLPILLMLRKPDLSVSFPLSVDPNRFDKTIGEVVVNNSLVTSAKMSGCSEKNGLVLYYNEYSFYSQKVVMALYEKHLPFTPHSIELTGEQYQPWFLQINPKGEVPVLQDTGKIISDSARIIDYLEDNFSNGDTPRLVPQDQGNEVKQKVTNFRNLIDNINGNVLTVGSLMHPELATGSKKIPFIKPVRSQLLNADKDSAENLKKYSKENAEARQMLLEKAENQEKKHEQLLIKDEFVKILNETEKIFDKVEAELAEHDANGSKDWWLCSDSFTVADISLTILLLRISQIGMEPYFWSDGKRPQVEKYFARVQERESYKNTAPTSFSLVKTIFKTQISLILGGLFGKKNH
ncbi:ganglioside-induced differentiation-associated protein 1 isoform X2 [Euwallacea fornicatus]|uniref:ganglioside-induced differentiation-associated protein 1 isoform X2 n=1 Tax=Euwallacea fornicatus TaxID=995702 RepID=UPI00338FAA84